MLVDTNVLVRHFTGDPPGLARRATAFLAETGGLIVTDVVLTELVYVLESFYERPRAEVADCARAVVGFRSVVISDQRVLSRTLEIYERHRLHFADAYLAATAEVSGVGRVASFDRSIDRVGTVQRVEP